MRAQQLRAWRERQGLTQEEAADWWGCHPRTWQRYELGECAVPRPLENRIADTLPSTLSPR